MMCRRTFENNINIASLVADTDEYGIVRPLVSDPKQQKNCVKAIYRPRHGPFAEMAPQPGSLYEIMRHLWKLILVWSMSMRLVTVVNPS